MILESNIGYKKQKVGKHLSSFFYSWIYIKLHWKLYKFILNLLTFHIHLSLTYNIYYYVDSQNKNAKIQIQTKLLNKYYYQVVTWTKY